MISAILGMEMLFLQLSRCALNAIPLPLWAWKRRQEINSGLCELENSAGKEKMLPPGAERESQGRESCSRSSSGGESFELCSPATSTCPALCGEVWLQEVPRAGIALPVPCLTLGVGWAGPKGCHIPRENAPEARGRD